MPYQKTLRAGTVVFGTPLPPYYMGDRFVSHRANDIEWTDDDEFIIIRSDIITNGDWKFHWDENVTFPRRSMYASQQRINWNLSPIFPRLRDLAVGDVIGPSSLDFMDTGSPDPRFLPDWNDEDYWPEDAKREAMIAYNAANRRTSQVVRAIVPYSTNDVGLATLITTDLGANRVAKHNFPSGNKIVQFPFAEVNSHGEYVPIQPPEDNDAAPEIRKTLSRVSANYDIVSYVGKEGEEVAFAIHPTGKGRWNNALPHYSRLRPSSVMRPPTREVVEEWYYWQPKSRDVLHPRDPRARQINFHTATNWVPDTERS